LLIEVLVSNLANAGKTPKERHEGKKAQRTKRYSNQSFIPKRCKSPLDNLGHLKPNQFEAKRPDVISQRKFDWRPDKAAADRNELLR